MNIFKVYQLEPEKIKFLMANKSKLNKFELGFLSNGVEWSWRVSSEKMHKTYEVMLMKCGYEDKSSKFINDIEDSYKRQLDRMTLLIDDIRRDYDNKIDKLNRTIKILAIRVDKITGIEE
jgi:hypothetical protein